MNGTASNSINNSVTHSNSLTIINKRSSNKKRSESVVIKSVNHFSPTGYEPYDKETMKEEMNKLIKEINSKTKEFKSLLNSHIQTEAENLKTIKLIESIIVDCKQIQNPIERNNSLSQITSNKSKSLLSNLQETLNSYELALMSKEKHLEELKKSNPKILRLFDIENKLVTVSQKHEAIAKRHAEVAKRLFELEVESMKAVEATELFKRETVKLKQEMEDLKEKIRGNDNENGELEVKEKMLEERNVSNKKLLSDIKASLKEKEEELERLKEKMVEYNALFNDKGKAEGGMANQMKQVQSLKESNEKKSKQLREIEKVQTEYINEVNNLKAMQKASNIKLIAIQNERKAKEDQFDQLKKENERLKRLISDKSTKAKPIPYTIHTQIAYSCNIPFTIDSTSI